VTGMIATTTAAGPPSWAQRVGRIPVRVVAPSTWKATMHIVLDFFIGLPIFVFLVVALVTTGGLACTIVLAVPALWLTLVFVRILGLFERARFGVLLDVALPDPYPPFIGSFWTRVRDRFFGASAWKELAYMLMLFPFGCIGLFLVTAAWSGSLAVALLPLYIGRLPGSIAHLGVFDINPGWQVWVTSLIGIGGLLLAPFIVRGWAALDVFIGRSLLSRGVTAELEERVDELETTRSWAIEVAEAERRRIERDLHDGAQQRLVALAMDLGMAKQKLDSDPEGARVLIDQAHNEAKRALVELRDLARGIHPVALSDRGLPGAIPALAGRCAIPVDVRVDVPIRPAASIEGIAYFIVSECLANVVKHSRADHVTVTVTRQGDRLFVEVVDNGVGGAHPLLGSGLSGLADRAASVDGILVVSSPVGGPTSIRAELPCAS
jgi:signal transduction histidine kinase